MWLELYIIFIECAFKIGEICIAWYCMQLHIWQDGADIILWTCGDGYADRWAWCSRVHYSSQALEYHDLPKFISNKPCFNYLRNVSKLACTADAEVSGHLSTFIHGRVCFQVVDGDRIRYKERQGECTTGSWHDPVVGSNTIEAEATPSFWQFLICFEALGNCCFCVPDCLLDCRS